MLGVFVVLAMSARESSGEAVNIIERVRDGLIYAMIAATALSGLQYLWRAAFLFRAD